MIKPVTTLVAILLAAVITSCGTLRVVDLSKVSIGMSKAEVQAALRKKPDNIVAAKHFTNPEATVEVVEYSTGNVASYYLYFVNDKLDKWHEVAANEPAPDLRYYNFGR